MVQMLEGMQCLVFGLNGVEAGSTLRRLKIALLVPVGFCFGSNLACLQFVPHQLCRSTIAWRRNAAYQRLSDVERAFALVSSGAIRWKLDLLY